MSEKKVDRGHSHMANINDAQETAQTLAKLKLQQKGRAATPSAVAQTMSETEQNKGEARYED